MASLILSAPVLLEHVLLPHCVPSVGEEHASVPERKPNVWFCESEARDLKVLQCFRKKNG
jgi:hypothetical protein